MSKKDELKNVTFKTIHGRIHQYNKVVPEFIGDYTLLKIGFPESGTVKFVPVSSTLEIDVSSCKEEEKPDEKVTEGKEKVTEGKDKKE